MTCPHRGEPIEGHGTACRPEAYRRITTGPPSVYSPGGVALLPLDDVRRAVAEREAQQAEARAILAEWHPEGEDSPVERRLRALLERVAGVRP